jgi:hypothetical membrane protein
MRMIIFWSAILGFAIFLLTVLVGGATFPDYSHARQYISELGATGAPHSQLVAWLGFVPSSVLLAIFSLAAPLTLPRSVMAWIGFLLISYYSIGMAVAGIYPCDFGCRPDDPSMSQFVHNVAGGTAYLAGITAILLLGIQSRKWPRSSPLMILGIVCWVVAACAFPFLADHEFEYTGVAQRMIEACIFGWILACAFYIRRSTEVRSNQ